MSVMILSKNIFSSKYLLLIKSFKVHSHIDLFIVVFIVDKVIDLNSYSYTVEYEMYGKTYEYETESETFSVIPSSENHPLKTLS